MKKINFNSLKNVSTPEKWIETALNIPQKKKAIPFYLKTYFLATAASVILCCALSLLIFMGTGTSTGVLPASKATDPASSSVQSTYPDGSQYNQQGGYTELVTNSSGEVIDIIINSDAPPVTEPKESDLPQGTNASSPSGTNPAQGVNPSSASGSSGTDSPLPPVTGAPHSTEKPTSKPVRPSSVLPTISTELPYVADVSASQSVPGAGEEGFKNSIIFVPSGNTEFDLSGKIYCHIEDPDYGSFTAIDSPHEKCTKLYYQNRLCASYNPFNKLGLQYSYKNYYVTFYDSKGHSISASCYLGKSDCFVYE